MKEENLQQEFEQDLKTLNGSIDPFFFKQRKEALRQFELAGIPTRKNESYKYTDLNKTFRSFEQLAPNRHPAEPAAVSFELPDLGDVTILAFVNGVYRSDLSTLPSDDSSVTILPLAEAVKSRSELVESYFGKIAPAESDALVALNTAFATGGVLIHIGKNQQAAPVILRYYNDATNGNSITYSRNLIIAEEGSESLFIEQYNGQGENELLLNQVNEVLAGKNSSLTWFKLQDYAAASQIDQLAIHQLADSRVTINTCTLEGKVIRNNIRVKLLGENCETHLYGAYLADESMHVDNQTVVDHTVPHCMSNELYKGILDDKAHGVFNGKVYVRAEAQKTNAFQSNKNILLSDTATINTKPQLEIWADDVKCSHGCTTGQLDEEALFYLRSRGLDKHSATALLLYAFALETVEEVQNEKLRNFLAIKISDKLKYPFA